ncbi:glycosyltransferase family A protein [Marinobacterium mangrovicola]|uniref:Glycosyl transferase family 2 n=1 Tax=Marinobacterium mangrovicola TaxID=1476959 RepID=A0A4R1GLV4_9GAMM|nr:glycosyltransferase family A protein [Marinobacterium mangrovicola]TCK07129.1 glycosyl transferase family 2 [Marinobacterium mangrovicola]
MTYFSVIIPVFNKEPHVKRAIESVLNQSIDSFEIIIVCDPSTDKSDEVVNNFKDSRIHVYNRNKPGPGGYAARNLGVKKSTFDWVVFLDADDEWSPNHLEKLSCAISQNPNINIFSSSWIIRENGRETLDKYSKYNRKTDIVILSVYEYLLNEVCGKRPIWTSVACIKKQILMSAGLFPEGRSSMGGDIDTWLRCVFFSKYMVWINNLSAIYHRDSVNMVTKNSYIDPLIHRETTDKLLHFIKDKKVNILLKKRLNKIIITAWNNNERLAQGNFDILDEIYVSVINLKALFCVILSRLPVYYRCKVHKIMSYLSSSFRNLLN